MSATTTQPSERLIPDVVPESAVEWVSPDKIRFEDVGPAPEAELEEKIRTQGILTPLTLARRQDGTYDLVAGRRRLRVARKLQILLVPALVLSDPGMTSISALTDHATRRDNPAADLAHIERLVQRGASIQEIHRATGMAVKTIKARMALGRLAAPLRQAFDRGKLATTVAEAAARLPPEVQSGLAAKLAATGRLTQEDVKGVRKAAREPARPTLEGFDLPTVDPTEAPPIPATPPRLTPELERTCRELVALLRAERRRSLADQLEGALARAGAT